MTVLVYMRDGSIRTTDIADYLSIINRSWERVLGIGAYPEASDIGAIDLRDAVKVEVIL